MNTNKKFEQLRFIIPSYYANALINDDFSGLNQQEESEIDDFISRVYCEYKNTYFIYNHDIYPYFSTYNNVNNLAGDVAHVFLMIETK
jgi:hypothetical protein